MSNTAETDLDPIEVNATVPLEDLEASTQEHVCPDPVTSQCGKQVKEDSDDTGDFEDDKIEEDESEEKFQEAKSQVSSETICDVTAVQQVMVPDTENPAEPIDEDQSSPEKPKRTLRGRIKCMAMTSIFMICAEVVLLMVLFFTLLKVEGLKDSALDEANDIACYEGQQGGCTPKLSYSQRWDCRDSVRELCLESQKLAWDETKEEFWKNISEIATRTNGLSSTSVLTSLPTGLNLIECETQRDQRFGASCKKVQNRKNLLKILAGVFLGTHLGLGLSHIILFFTMDVGLIVTGFACFSGQFCIGSIVHLYIRGLPDSSPLWWGSSALVTALLVLFCCAYCGCKVFEELLDCEDEAI